MLLFLLLQVPKPAQPRKDELQQSRTLLLSSSNAVILPCCALRSKSSFRVITLEWILLIWPKHIGKQTRYQKMFQIYQSNQ